MAMSTQNNFGPPPLERRNVILWFTDLYLNGRRSAAAFRAKQTVDCRITPSKLVSTAAAVSRPTRKKRRFYSLRESSSLAIRSASLQSVQVVSVPLLTASCSIRFASVLADAHHVCL